MPEIQRFCPYCKKPVEATDEYCPYCGKKLSDIDDSKMTGESRRKKEKNTSFNVDSRSLNDQSVLSLVLGIASFVFPYIGLVCAILAIVFGAKNKKNDSYAKAGFILGIVSCCVIVGYSIFTFIYMFYITKIINDAVKDSQTTASLLYGLESLISLIR